MPRQPKITPALIEAEKAMGYKQNEIARRHGVTPSEVSRVKHKHTRFSRTPREKVMSDHFPLKNVWWKLTWTRPYKGLANHLEYRATAEKTGGKDWSASKRKSYRDWLQQKDGLDSGGNVLVYDPGIKHDRCSYRGGFTYVKRDPRIDGDFVVRPNEHVTVTELNQYLLGLPKVWPDL